MKSKIRNPEMLLMLLLKIKWKQHHYLYKKWAELLSGTASHVTVSDVEKLHAQV